MNESLIDEAIKARKKAYTPYSHFSVGAILIAKSGFTYSGCNIENTSFGLTSCAERNAIFAAVTAGEHEFKKIVVVGDTKDVTIPCGACLQVMAEFFSANTEVVLANLNGLSRKYLFKELFPVRFNLKDDRRV